MPTRLLTVLFNTHALFSLYSNGMNFFRYFCFEVLVYHAYLPLKLNPAECIYVRYGVRQGVLSPHVFKMCVAFTLALIRSTYYNGMSDISYLGYADDILLISRSKSSLYKMVGICS